MKKSKSILMLLTCGSMVFGGGLGCLNLERFLQYGLYYGALEFVTDNDGIFDLFESGNVPAA